MTCVLTLTLICRNGLRILTLKPPYLPPPLNRSMGSGNRTLDFHGGIDLSGCGTCGIVLNFFDGEIVGEPVV